MSKFFNREFELENRVLGDIDYHADNAEAFVCFFDFTLEEVKGRYMDFLHLGAEADQPLDQQENPGSDQVETEESEEPQELYEPTEAPLKVVDENLQHEMEERKGESIQAAFVDYNFWKPQIDYNLDDLLKEMNKSQ